MARPLSRCARGIESWQSARTNGSRSQTVVAYDHARHAPLGDVHHALDFINTGLEPRSATLGSS